MHLDLRVRVLQLELEGDRPTDGVAERAAQVVGDVEPELRVEPTFAAIAALTSPTRSTPFVCFRIRRWMSFEKRMTVLSPRCLPG